MTEREFDETLRARYHAAASSWTPEAKTRAALLERLAAKKAPRRVSSYLRPAAALCCCVLIVAAALFAWRGQSQDLALSEETVPTNAQADAAAPYAAATAGMPEETGEVSEKASGEAAGAAADSANGAVSPKQAEPNTALAAMEPETYADTEQAENDAAARQNSALSLTGEQARAVPELGALLPVSLEAFPEETAYEETSEAGTVLALVCTGTGGELFVRVSAVTQEQRDRMVSVDEPETYDLTRYGFPLAETVPADLLPRVENPVFAARELSVSVLEARREPEEGTMRFGVLCGDFVAEYVCKGMTAQEAYDAVTSAPAFPSGT